MADEDYITRKKSVTKLKSRILDEILEAMDRGMSSEEIIGTLESTKQQTSEILLAAKIKKDDKEIKGYA